MKSQPKALLEIHFSVLLFGLAGLFGNLQLPATSIVFGRVFFSVVAIGLVFYFIKQNIRLHVQRDYLAMCVLGVVLAIHWSTFFYSVQISTVAIALLTFSTFPLFTTFLEPLAFKERIKIFDILVALLTIIGITLIIPSFDLSNNITQGVIWGTLSGLTFAMLSILNRKFVKKYNGFSIVFYQNAVAMIVLLPFVVSSIPMFSTQNILLLALLGIVFTAVPHSLFIKGMSHIKAQRASIISSLAPVYGIIFAMLLFSEIPSLRTIVGGTIILIAAFIATKIH